MAEDDIPVPASTLVPFIGSQKMDSAFKYHSFEFVLINNIPEGRAFLEPKRFRNRVDDRSVA